MKKPKKKLRIGVVGTGYLGKFHAEKYARMDDVELVGIADINQTQAEKIAKKYSTKAYTSHRNILDKVDAVSIVVPTPVHFEVSRDFLKHDVDVLIEKPITTTIKEADELIGFAESKGLIIQVGHLERFNPAVIALRDYITRPMFIESHRLSTFKERAADVSVVLDLMIHDIDIISNLVRSGIKSIHAAGTPVISGHVDIANTRMEFENGCVANVTASRISTRDERKIRLFQKDAYISVDFANRQITIVKKNDKDKRGIIPGMDINKRCFNQGDALDDELKAFVKAVKKRESPEVTGQVGRDALKIALDIMQQIQNRNQKLAHSL
ncbi:MAG: Gfo/Idh/MocA family oxidoreductase [Thermodesulfobacteriota bacterium]|nr:Gfo/Idh/MocA family oxidoreductase [Thermodesulfobacteriota bacterium]